MSKRCPECGEPPHYHSWCTLCAQLFWASRWRRLDNSGRDREFKQVYFRTGSIGETAAWLGITKDTAYLRRKRLQLPAFPPDGNRRSTWLPEHDAKLAEAIADGATRKETAALLNRSCLSVGCRRGVLGLPHFRRPPNWKKGRRHPLADQVAELRRAAFSLSQIGGKLRVSRNVVAGIVDRHLKGEARP